MSARAADNVTRQVNPLLSISKIGNEYWLSCGGCDDGRAAHWHSLSKGLYRCLTGATEA